MSLFLEIQSGEKNNSPIIIDLEKVFAYKKVNKSNIQGCYFSIELLVSQKFVTTLDFIDQESRDKVYDRIREALVIQI